MIKTWKLGVGITCGWNSDTWGNNTCWLVLVSELRGGAPQGRDPDPWGSQLILMSLSSEKQSDGAGTSIIKKSMFEGEAQYLNNWPISKKFEVEWEWARLLCQNPTTSSHKSRSLTKHPQRHSLNIHSLETRYKKVLSTYFLGLRSACTQPTLCMKVHESLDCIKTDAISQKHQGTRNPPKWKIG